MIIVILLHDDRFHYFDITVVLDVVVTKNCYTEMNLLLFWEVRGDVVKGTVLLKLKLLDRVGGWEEPLLLAIYCTIHVV